MNCVQTIKNRFDNCRFPCESKNERVSPLVRKEIGLGIYYGMKFVFALTIIILNAEAIKGNVTSGLSLGIANISILGCAKLINIKSIKQRLNIEGSLYKTLFQKPFYQFPPDKKDEVENIAYLISFVVFVSITFFNILGMASIMDASPLGSWTIGLCFTQVILPEIYRGAMMCFVKSGGHSRTPSKDVRRQ